MQKVIAPLVIYPSIIYRRAIIVKRLETIQGKMRRNVEERTAGGVRPFLTAHFLTPPRFNPRRRRDVAAAAVAAAAATGAATRTTDGS